MNEVAFLKKELADARAENQVLTMRLRNVEYLYAKLLSKSKTTKDTTKNSRLNGDTLPHKPGDH